MTDSGRRHSEPLAIVGIGCRLPGGGDDPESFWSLLIDQRSGIREVPADRWNLDRFYHPDPAAAGAMVMKRGGFIENLAGFDAAFWGVAPREALRMDPQQRWLLEVAWEAIEDAGVAPSRLRGHQIGVFVGISGNDYGGLQLRSTEDVDAYTNSGSTASIASNRISYMLDLRGPSLSIDTACSSALVAAAAACDSIWSGRCEGALAGGVNALVSPQTSVGFSKASMISPTGQCFAFDARANGFVRAEGAGLVYLKPLSAALADGNRIYALIRGTAVNQDGHTSSMTVPGVEGQSAMLDEAYRQAGIAPSRVAYVEAHGTGTPVGDPIEATALGRVLGRGRTRPCLIGSVKTNIGHLESGSGIAGLIKAALVLYHRTIPATLNHEQPNSAIPFEDLHLEVAARTQPLPADGSEPPVVGVNSFGFGGTNAHAVLEAAPPAAAAPSAHLDTVDRPYLLPISARDEMALRHYVQRYRTLLKNASAPLGDVCASAGACKEHHARRVVLIGRDQEEIRTRAAAWLRDGAAEGVVTGALAPHSAPVFVFAGQGPQWWAMGRQLLDREPIFRRVFEEIDARIRDLAGWSLLAELDRPEADSRIDRTDIAQPAIFALQAALVALWESWGIRPAKVIGHSVGEVAAAYCAGVYSLGDAVKIIVHRSRLQHTTFGGGRMLAAAVSEDEARAAIADDSGVEIGAVNSPRFVTLAGTVESLQAIDARLQERGVFTRWLRGGYAFHSAQMDPIREELLAALDDIQPLPARIPLVSTVTGAPFDGASMDALYWFLNIRQPVLFGPAVADSIRRGDTTFLELSPHPVLESSIKEALAAEGQTGAVFHSLRRGADDSQELAATLAGLHVLGVPVEWTAANQGSGARVRLPHYPWNREDFWIESSESARVRVEPAAHPLLGQRIESAAPTWQLTLDLHRLPYLADHRVWDTVVFPAAAYGEMGLAVARILFSSEPHAVEDLEIKKALFVREEDRTVLQTVFDPEYKSFAIYSSTRGAARWELHAQGTLARTGLQEAGAVDLDALRSKLTVRFDRAHYLRELELRGYQFGPSFTQVQAIWSEGSEVLIEIDPPTDVADATGYVFHPAIQDACFHTFTGLPLEGNADGTAALYLPHSIARLHLRNTSPATRLWAHGIVRCQERSAVVADISVYDDGGIPVADILGFRIERVEQKQKPDLLADCGYQFHWKPKRLRGSGVHRPLAFPRAAELAGAMSAALPHIAERHGLRAYHDSFVPDAEATAALLAQRAFTDLGWKPCVGDRLTLATFMRALGIERDYQRVTLRLLRHLDRIGLLRRCGEEEWEVVRLPDGSGSDTAVGRLAEKYPACNAEIELFRRTGVRLASVLSGEADPLELLFPGGSHEVVERFYAEALAFPAHLELTRTAVAAALASMPKERAVRVLEVGAGTGMLTRAVLPVLPANRTEYLFTDVGAAFVAAARKRLSDFSFVDYQSLDIESDPVAQGIVEGQFDLVLAADVVHATADVRQTLTHLRKCLAPGGLLVLLELAQPDFVRDDVTFGLLRGYSRFTDTDLRPYSPLMSPARWLQVLDECGFHDVGAVESRAGDEPGEHAVILAFAPAAAAAATPPETQSSRTAPYMLFADESGVADALAARLRESGREAVVVKAAGRTWKAPERPEIAGLIDCRSLDHPPATDMSVSELQRAQQTGVLGAFHLVRALAGRPARVWFVTRDARRVLPEDQNTGLAAAPLIGFARVANNEHQCRFTTIDIDACTPGEASLTVFDEITLPDDGEFEVAYRDGVRYALRLERVSQESLPRRTFNAIAPDGVVTPFRLHTDQPGILANLRLHETRRRAPEPNEVEVRVHAGGINFRDVMKALGTHPGNPPDLLWFGDDFAGIVERVGSAVTHLQPGDAVAGMAPYAFRSFVCVDTRLAFKKPNRLSLEQATTIPTVFLTAHYAMTHLAQMQPGESILIHAGTGGVGLAALQIAKHLNLEIFATAGTPEKRKVLASLGVPHVMDSRSLDFADEIMAATGGRGVDAVLNSLAGDFIPKSLSVLAPFGRFLEIGKVDIYRNSKIGLHRLRDNISYFVIDLTQHLQHRRDFVVKMFEEIRAHFERGDYAPIPFTAFPIADAVEAFRFMAQGKHVGKNVLTFNHPDIPIAFSTEPGERFRPDATYLVTGGAGGFGLEVAKWIAREGGRHLVLMSRSGPRDATAVADVAALRLAGVDVVDARADVTVPGDVARVLSELQKNQPPLRGVFHAAMVLDDDLILELDEDRFKKALDPKMLGAWNLHVATARLPLDHFVCFSSFSNVIGMLRQSNYSAGNAFLDALAEYRRGCNLPALSVNWGAITGTGFVERDQKTADTLSRLGFGSLDKAEAVRILDRLMVADAPHVAAARVDWQAVMKLSPLAAASSTYAALTRETEGKAQRGSLEAQLRGATPEEQDRLLEGFIVSQVAGVFGLPDEKVSRTVRLNDLGLDSLMTLELTNRVERELGVRIPMGAIVSGPTIVELASTVRQMLAPALSAGDSGTSKAAEPALAPVDHLVRIKPGEDIPIFCFHPVGGGVGIYTGLTPHLPESLPLYGVESRLVKGASREFDTREEMVDAYVAALRSVHAGPYRLFGFSFGGYIAACVAERLEASGAAVEFVGVIDWDAQQQLTAEVQRESLVRLCMASYGFMQEEMGLLRPRSEHQLREEISRLVERVASEESGGGDAFYEWVVSNELAASKALEEVAREYLVRFEQHCRLLTRGLPCPSFAAPLVVWRASNGFGSPLESWGRNGARGREYVFDGDHNALMRPAALRTVAEQLNDFMMEGHRLDLAGTTEGYLAEAQGACPAEAQGAKAGA